MESDEERVIRIQQGLRLRNFNEQIAEAHRNNGSFTSIRSNLVVLMNRADFTQTSLPYAGNVQDALRNQDRGAITINMAAQSDTGRRATRSRSGRTNESDMIGAQICDICLGSLRNDPRLTSCTNGHIFHLICVAKFRGQKPDPLLIDLMILGCLFIHS